jgi:polyisoprenoid-binding protein YceI
MRVLALSALFGSLCLAPLASAQNAGSLPQASQDPAAAPEGAYVLDNHHTSLVARVAHMNTNSYSTFRFGKEAGALDWTPGRPQSSKLDVTIDFASIMTPVEGFAAELQGERFLDAAKYPTAHFVSTSIDRTGPRTGLINGELTFMGKTRPLTISAEMVGVGRTMGGKPAVGFTGKARIKRSDFGFTTLIPVISDEIELQIDTEFDKAG